MKVNSVRSFLKRCLADLNKAEFRLQQNAADLEAIHQYRVGIKKLRALARFANFLNGDKKKHQLPEVVKKFYCDLGAIRQAQLQSETLREGMRSGHERRNLLKSLDGKIKRGKKRAIRHFPDSTNDLKRLVRNMNAIFEEAGDRNFMNAQKRWMRRMLMGDMEHLVRGSKEEKEFIHDRRRRIKDVMYVIMSSGERETAAGQRKLKFLHFLQDFIGKWHDTTMTLDFLEKHKGTDALRTHFRRSAARRLSAIRKEMTHLSTRRY